MKPIELDASRQNLKPRPKGLSDDQYLIIALREGYALLAAEAKVEAKAGPSVKSDSVIPTPSPVQDALAKKSNNPYVKAKIQLLDKMLPLQRKTIERMDSGEIPKDARYDMFITQIAALGDKLSSLN